MSFKKKWESIKINISPPIINHFLKNIKRIKNTVDWAYWNLYLEYFFKVSTLLPQLPTGPAKADALQYT